MLDAVVEQPDEEVGFIPPIPAQVVEKVVRHLALKACAMQEADAVADAVVQQRLDAPQGDSRRASPVAFAVITPEDASASPALRASHLRHAEDHVPEASRSTMRATEVAVQPVEDTVRPVSQDPTNADTFTAVQTRQLVDATTPPSAAKRTPTERETSTFAATTTPSAAKRTPTERKTSTVAATTTPSAATTTPTERETPTVAAAVAAANVVRETSPEASRARPKEMSHACKKVVGEITKAFRVCASKWRPDDPFAKFRDVDGNLVTRPLTQPGLDIKAAMTWRENFVRDNEGCEKLNTAFTILALGISQQGKSTGCNFLVKGGYEQPSRNGPRDSLFQSGDGHKSTTTRSTGFTTPFVIVNKKDEKEGQAIDRIGACRVTVVDTRGTDDDEGRDDLAILQLAELVNELQVLKRDVTLLVLYVKYPTHTSGHW